MTETDIRPQNVSDHLLSFKQRKVMDSFKKTWPLWGNGYRFQKVGDPSRVVERFEDRGELQPTVIGGRGMVQTRAPTPRKPLSPPPRTGSATDS